jgi:drug/metabolite transporter (DMT)-like permease
VATAEHAASAASGRLAARFGASRVGARVATSYDMVPLAAACVSVFCWGIGPLAIRGIAAPSAVIAFWRSWMAVPVTVVAARLSGARLSFAVVRRTCLAGVLFAVSLVTGWAAIQQTSVANATLIPALQPVLVLMVASRFLGESIRRRDIVLASLSIVGVLVFVFGGGGTGGSSWQGDLWAVVNLVVWTAYFLEVKRQRMRGIATMAFLSGVMLWSALALTPYVMVTGGDLRSVRGWEWALIAFVVFVPGMTGHGLMTWAQRFVNVSTLSLLTLASPVISAVGAWWLYDQGLTSVQLVGGTVVLAAIGGIVASHRARVVEEPLAE